MPRRTRSHRLEDEARDHVKRAFHSFGWTCEDLFKDYGEDLLVRIFMEEKATPLSFFVQSKSTDDLEGCRKGKHHFRCRVKHEHLRHWSAFNEPVIFTLFDPTSGKTYWEQIQYFTRTKWGKKRLRREAERTSVYIPTENVLNVEGIRRIHNIARRQYRRNQYQKAGSRVLLRLLEDRAGIHVKEYSPKDEVLVIDTEDGGAEVILFGDLAEVVDLRCQLENATSKDILLNGSREDIGAHLDQQSWRLFDELNDVEDVLPALRKELEVKEALQNAYVVLSQMPNSSPEEMQSALSEVETRLSSLVSTL